MGVEGIFIEGTGFDNMARIPLREKEIDIRVVFIEIQNAINN